MKTTIITLLVLSIIHCSSVLFAQLSNEEIKRLQSRAEKVEIIRDGFGVPHVYGESDADVVFGLIYAHCEDDFPRIERNYIWAIGRLAEVDGKELLYSDLRSRLFMTEVEAKEEYAKCPAWLQKLCVAWADGINYYLHTHPDTKPALLTHFEPWMTMYFTEGSIGGDIERVSTRKIEEFYSGESATTNDHGYLPESEATPFQEPQGSNGFSLSGSRTKSGNAMLLINPHTSFFFRGEAHVVSQEGLNAYGAVTWGQFFIYQGFNEFNGWMHTSTGTDIIDEFEETIIKKDGQLYYEYGDELRKVDSKEVTLKYKEADLLKDKSFTIYRTHHGPITAKQDDKWIATALMWNPSVALQQSYLRTKTNSQADFHALMDFKTNSSNNTVYADADGNIGYYHGNFIPKRSAKFDYTKPVDGSNPETDWQGLHEVNELIHVLNPSAGWLQNCNSTPYTCCGDDSPNKEDYPTYFASFPENFRGMHAIPLLKNAENMTIDKLIRLAHDPYLPGAEVALKSIHKIPIDLFDLEYQKAIKKLQKWDYEVSVKSVEMSMLRYYIRTFYASGKLPEDVRSFMEIVNYIGNEAPQELCIEMMTEALNKLEKDFGSRLVKWGEINRYQRLGGSVKQEFNDSLSSTPIGMASGNWGALASFGARNGANTKRIYGRSGNSFVAVVEFGPKLKAKSILVGGQSGDPKSAHFDDQVLDYAQKKFKDVHFYKQDVLKNAKRIYHPGQQ